MGFGCAELEDVVEDEAGELCLLLADSEAVVKHGEEPVHELEISQTQRLHRFRLASEVGEDFEDGLSDFWCGVDQQSGEIVDFLEEYSFAKFFLLLDECPQ